MPWEPFHLTREQVYEADWAEPMRDAAKKFGISDVALGKVCRKLTVPRPRQGYWLRRSVGQSSPKTPLPPLQAGQLAKHEGQRWREPPLDPSRPAIPRRPIPPADSERIVVPEKLIDLHPCVKHGIVKLQLPHSYGLGYRPFIAVSVASRDRGLRIMNALVRALETRGHRVETREQSRSRETYRPAATGAHVGEAFVVFSMFERSKMLRNGPAPKKRANETTAETTRRISWPKVEYVPRGILTLRVGGWYESQQDWTDDKRIKFEDRLHEVIAGVLAHAEKIQATRIERARALEAEHERERQRTEAEKRRREEEERVANLRAMLADWREVHDARAFIEEARAIVALGGLTIRPNSTLVVIMT